VGRRGGRREGGEKLPKNWGWISQYIFDVHVREESLRKKLNESLLGCKPRQWFV